MKWGIGRGSLRLGFSVSVSKKLKNNSLFASDQMVERGCWGFPKPCESEIFFSYASMGSGTVNDRDGDCNGHKCMRKGLGKHWVKGRWGSTGLFREKEQRVWGELGKPQCGARRRG